MVLYRLLKSNWLFPVLLLLPLIVLSALKISGSSIGVYSMIDGIKDPNAITANYRGVRSDEWVVSTQMTVAQSQNKFRCLNRNIANGQDMSLMGDVPCKDWSAAFKPQNLVFFILPLEAAFAFRWWVVGLVLVVAAYFLVLEFFPKKRLLATLLSSFLGLTPLLFWWYSASTFLCVTYSILALLLAIRIISNPANQLRLLYAAVLSYVLICFALILYPPFLIACALPVATFSLGFGLEKLRRGHYVELLKAAAYVLAASLVAGLVVIAFLKTRSAAVNAVTQTVYPGKRIEISGGVDPLLSFSSFLSPNLQYDARAATGYLRNQSEAANFIFIAPYLFLPSLYLIYEERRRRGNTLWGLIMINALMIILLARMYLATPWLEPFYRLLGQTTVPPTRLLIGLGLAGFIQLIIIIKTLGSSQLSKVELRWLAGSGAASALVTMLYVGFYTLSHYPNFISNPLKVSIFALWVTAGIFFILRKRFYLGLALLVMFSLFSVFRILPLYRGLGPLTTSPPIRAIQSYPDDGNWIVLDDRLLINFPLVAGKHALNSVQFYPQLALWHQLDPNGQYTNDYNRYAHVVFDDDKTLTTTFGLPQADVLEVKFEPCGRFLQKNAKYVLTPKKLTQDCLVLKQSIVMPTKDLYIYQITPPKSAKL